MFQVDVDWLDEGRTRAKFSLPGREEWRVEHIDALIHLLAEIRAQMSPETGEPPRPQDARLTQGARPPG